MQSGRDLDSPRASGGSPRGDRYGLMHSSGVETGGYVLRDLYALIQTYDVETGGHVLHDLAKKDDDQDEVEEKDDDRKEVDWAHGRN